MTITRADVERAAQLSRLALRDDELDRIAKDLLRIVGYVEQLQTVDVAGVAPMTHPFADVVAGGGGGAQRVDEAAAVLGRRAIEHGPAYDADNGMVKVPKVVE